MKLSSVSHLEDAALACSLKASVSRENGSTAIVVVHIAEFDARRLYEPAGYPSMRAYCIEELKYSEDAASKRIHAARAAREFPAIFEALAEGRLHLTGVSLLAPHLTPTNAEGLLAAAAFQTKEAIKRLVAERFPSSEMLPLVQVAPVATTQQAVGPRGANVMQSTAQHAPAHVESHASRTEVTPIAAQRYTLPLSFGQLTHEKLQHLQELLGHSLSAEEFEAVFARGLDARNAELEKRKFAATDRPRRGWPRRTGNSRYVPRGVRRVVWARDGGQCTFVSESGHLCGSRRHLQYDHIVAIALGGESTVDNVRLRCRAHNQYEADRTFGTGFMDGKRAAGREATAARARAQVETGHMELMKRDLILALRRLGYRADEARERATMAFASMPLEATLEDLVRAALRGPRYAASWRGESASA